MSVSCAPTPRDPLSGGAREFLASPISIPDRPTPFPGVSAAILGGGAPAGPLYGLAFYYPGLPDLPVICNDSSSLINWSSILIPDWWVLASLMAPSFASFSAYTGDWISLA